LTLELLQYWEALAYRTRTAVAMGESNAVHRTLLEARSRRALTGHVKQPGAAPHNRSLRIRNSEERPVPECPSTREAYHVDPDLADACDCLLVLPRARRHPIRLPPEKGWKK